MNNIKIVFKSLLLSFLITFILFAIYAAILAYTDVPESTIKVCTVVIGTLSVFMGSFFAVKKLGKNGLKNGGIIGLIYIIIIYLLSAALGNGFNFSSTSIISIIFYLLFGIVGGIMGANAQ